MAQDQTKKEALFNEVKGSLFEYLLAKEISIIGKIEMNFYQSIDKNYLTVLSQQDRMIRQFYPEMLPFLQSASKDLASRVLHYLKEIPSSVRVVGKFSNSSLSSQLHEADLILKLEESERPISLKLNKKNAFVNTKSGGIKSFFHQYFPFIDSKIQNDFNKFVDNEFNRMAFELHSLHDLEYSGNFDDWTKRGLSELPGELDLDSRGVLKSYYARIAFEMHNIFTRAREENTEAFTQALPQLMGFGSESILQVIYFHDFPVNLNPVVEIHSFRDLNLVDSRIQILPFNNISSVEIKVGDWSLQIRVKPMNKFTTTAMKINCSVKINRPSFS